MRALIITGPGKASVEDVAEPVALPGEAVVAVQRAGICGTDVAFFNGTMPFLSDGRAAYPMRIGHEWMGTVVAVGSREDDAWVGRRVMGDTMLGCRSCDRCANGQQHACASRLEVGVLGGKAGALAEYVCVPVSSLHELPASVDDAIGALVEPAGNAVRAVEVAGVAAGGALLVVGAGTIGILAALLALSRGIDVHVVGRSAGSREFAALVGLPSVWTWEDLPRLPFLGVIDASNSADVPRRSLDVLEPGGRLVCIGVAADPSLIDTRSLVFSDRSVVGILSSSPSLQATIDVFASGAVDPRPLIAATVGLADTASVLRGEHVTGPGPKIHIDPRR